MLHYVHQMIQLNKIFFSTVHAFLSHNRICSVIVCVMFRLRHVETESRFLVYPVHIASMSLSTGRFSCVIYAENCVNTTTDLMVKSEHPSGIPQALLTTEWVIT